MEKDKFKSLRLLRTDAVRSIYHNALIEASHAKKAEDIQKWMDIAEVAKELL